MTDTNHDLKNDSKKDDKEEFDASFILESALESMNMDKPGPNEEKLEVSEDFMVVVRDLGKRYKEAFEKLA